MSEEHIDVELNGTNWRMPISFAVSKQIAREVADPLQMTMKIAVKLWQWEIAHVVNVIFAGVSAAGCQFTRDQVGEAIMRGGVVNYIETAGQYVASLVNGKPARALPEEVENAGKKA